MEYQLYGYIALAILSPMLVAWTVRSLKLFPSVVKDYFRAMKSVIFKTA